MTMRMRAATADLSKDFNVYFVGDISLSTFPSNDTPRFGKNASLSFAALRRLITRVSWVRFVRPSSKSR